MSPFLAERLRGYPSALFSPGDSTSGALCPFLGFTVQQGHGVPGESPAEAYKDDWGSGTSLLVVRATNIELSITWTCFSLHGNFSASRYCFSVSYSTCCFYCLSRNSLYCPISVFPFLSLPCPQWISTSEVAEGNSGLCCSFNSSVVSVPQSLRTTVVTLAIHSRSFGSFRCSWSEAGEMFWSRFPVMLQQVDKGQGHTRSSCAGMCLLLLSPAWKLHTA